MPRGRKKSLEEDGTPQNVMPIDILSDAIKDLVEIETVTLVAEIMRWQGMNHEAAVGWIEKVAREVPLIQAKLKATKL